MFRFRSIRVKKVLLNDPMQTKMLLKTEKLYALAQAQKILIYIKELK